MSDVEENKYGELANEKEVVENIEAFSGSITEVQDLLETLIKEDVYDKLGTEDRIKHDLFLSYALTSLYWMYSRTLGEDPFTNVVKNEADRVQDYMKKYQRIKERKNAPQLNVAASKRFIKSGLWTPKDNSKQSNKRKTFDNDE
ncbi:uncharacterized protein LOC106669173 [Cimex lectularius]|uniref:Nuclear nucleic acid-binding protein C1D n=1 Tax=Cimex lectularius TaxID=79782 RepID=A0A8I6RZ66_CIMLE|nr:uncharacterized protein LOC106669173 [Cimex lectularius]